MRKLILVGYWVNKGTHLFHYTKQYPDPSKLQDVTFWKSRNKRGVIEYLKSGASVNHYRGFSSCRICGKRLGTTEITDGKYAWPSMMEHYMEEHDVKLPDWFYAHIESNSFKVPEEVKEISGTCHTDEKPWIDWSSQYLSDYKEPVKDVNQRNKAEANNRSVVEQIAIENMESQIRDAMDADILKRIDKGEIDLG